MSGLEFKTIGDLCADVDAAGPRKWLIRGIWPAGAYGVHAAEPKAGKTWNALDMAVSVASGTPWLGQHAVDTPGPVLVFAGEGGAGNLVRRLRAIADDRGRELEDLQIAVCIRAPHLADDEHMEQLTAALDLYRPVLVILDPLYLAAGGANGADLYAMGRVLERPQLATEKVGAALLVVTHYNRARDLKGAARITGAGPAEWGRVLISAAVISRSTDPRTQESTVLAEMDVAGGEVPDQVIRVRRRVRSVDPSDLDSALLYRTDEPEARSSRCDDLSVSPTAVKLLEAIEAQENPADGNTLVDWIKERYGHGVTRPKRSSALNELHKIGLADFLEPRPGGSRYWYRVWPGGDAE